MRNTTCDEVKMDGIKKIELQILDGSMMHYKIWVKLGRASSLRGIDLFALFSVHLPFIAVN